MGDLMIKMTNFLTLNLQDFGLNQGITETVTSVTPFCICCQHKGGMLISLENCSHTNYLQQCFVKLEVSMELTNHYVCFHCHTMLKKIEAFRRQVELSFQALSSQAQSTNSIQNQTIIKSIDLKRTEVTQLSVEDMEVKSELPIIADHLPNFSEPIVTIHEGNDNDDDHFDDEDDKTLISLHRDVDKVRVTKIDKDKSVAAPKTRSSSKTVKEKKRKNSEVVKNKKSSSKKTKRIKTDKKKDDNEANEDQENPPKPKKKREPMHKKFEGKIKVVTLTHDEMICERERDAEVEAYVNLPYKCDNCVVGFDHEVNYKEHLERRHTVKPGSLVCNICQSVLISDMSLKIHMKRHYTRFECLECGKRYIHIYSTMQHYSNEHGSVGHTYNCRHCDFKALTVSALAWHKNKHKLVQCEECGKRCSSRANLKTHLFAVHKKSNRTYICTVCNKKYITKSGLNSHFKTSHATDGPNSDAYCVDCNIQFKSLQCYKTHLRLSLNHLGADAKKFVCDECGSRFVTNGTLKRHYDWVHLKLLKHQCTKCMMNFRSPSMLEKHKKQVHEHIAPPRNKMCQYCGKGFTTAQILRTHIRTHTGERPLQCPYCPATFAHNAALYNHKKLIHKHKTAGHPANSANQQSVS